MVRLNYVGSGVSHRAYAGLSISIYCQGIFVSCTAIRRFPTKNSNLAQKLCS